MLFLQVTMATVTRLCVTKSIPTVNGRFPGPRIVVREGDRLVVQVHNNINNNVTFHWYLRIEFLIDLHPCMCPDPRATLLSLPVSTHTCHVHAFCCRSIIVA